MKKGKKGKGKIKSAGEKYREKEKGRKGERR